jgi:hypothetical protein
LVGRAAIRGRKIYEMLSPAFVSPFMLRCFGELLRTVAIDTRAAIGLLGHAVN